MSASSNPYCICNSVFKVDNGQCEADLEYLCHARASTASGVCFQLAGCQIERQAAIDTAADWLTRAKFPLFVGLDQIGIQSQQIALDICKLCNGRVDVSLDFNAAELNAITKVGASEASWGEIFTRCDLAIFIDSPIWESHPRVYSSLVHKKGTKGDQFETAWLGGKQDAVPLNFKLDVEPDALANFLAVLEHRLDGFSSASVRKRQRSESSLGDNVWEYQIEVLVEKIKRANYCCFFYSFETGDFQDRLKAEQVTSISQKIHEQTRAIAVNMGRRKNELGALQTTSWSTGFPTAVSFLDNHPDSLIANQSGKRLIADKQTDLVVSFSRSADKKWQCPAGIPHIEFGWGVNVQETPEKLVLNNLDVGGDDFLRNDGLSFKLNPNPQIAGPNRVGSVLKDLKSTITEK